jgi:glucose-6-phosphate 1-epimerase
MDTAAIAELDRQFGIPEIARILPGNGGLAKVTIATPAASGEMYLHGAHVTSWKPPGTDEVLYVSAHSRWEGGRAIRGGVPVCFPWFADKTDDPHAPAHGFVRAKAWRLESVVRTGDAVAVSMASESNGDTKRWWPADFYLVHRATFGGELTLELVVRNTGATALRFEEALHAYFRIGQIETAQLQGLNAVKYLDKTDVFRAKTQHGPVVITSETDRIYLDTGGPIVLNDPALRRSIGVAKENSLTTVVWNPWSDKARALSDLGEDEWKHMVCIETSNIADYAVNLAPGQEHTMRAIVRLVG